MCKVKEMENSLWRDNHVKRKTWRDWEAADWFKGTVYARWGFL